MNYTSNQFIIDCDFKANQKSLIDKSVNSLKEKIDEKSEQIISDYIKMSVNAKNVVERAQRESFQLYCNRMIKKLSEKSYYKQKEFESISDEITREAIKQNEIILQSIKTNFDFKFFLHITENNSNSIKKRIQTEKQSLEKRNNKNASNFSTIAIYFGRNNIFAVNYENEIKYILDKNENKSRPNCIAISDEILFGYEAKNFIQEFEK